MPNRKKSERLIEERQLLDAAGLGAAIQRMAEQILERNPEPKQLFLVGIRTGGAHLAARLRDLLSKKAGVEIPLGVMDITLYRDDVFEGLPRPEVGPTELPCTLEGHTVIVVDDVLFTGRTVRSALVELMDYGRPGCVQLAVLLDRGHRELPIQPDYVGLAVKTTRDQSIHVFLSELGHVDRVALFRKPKTGGAQ